MNTIKEKVRMLEEQIEDTARLLYQNKGQESGEEINQLITALIDLNGMVSEAIQAGEKIAFKEKEFNYALTVAMGALQQKDYVLFADIMRYEIREQVRAWIS